MNSNQNSSSYNNFLEATKIPHKIIEYLISSTSESAENIWKILYYTDVNCLSNDNLTFSQKNALRYLGSGLQDGKKIFLKPTISESLSNADNQTLIKMFRLRTRPTTEIEAIIDFEIDFLTNEVEHLVKYDNVYVEKTDLMEALFLDLFNGKDIGLPSSFLEYNAKLSSISQSYLDLGDSKSFYGRSCVMSLTYNDIQTGGLCS